MSHCMAAVRCSDDNGRTALHWAAVCGLEAVMPALLAAAADEQQQQLAAYQAAAGERL